MAETPRERTERRLEAARHAYTDQLRDVESHNPSDIWSTPWEAYRAGFVDGLHWQGRSILDAIRDA